MVTERQWHQPRHQGPDEAESATAQGRRPDVPPEDVVPGGREHVCMKAPATGTAPADEPKGVGGWLWTRGGSSSRVPPAEWPDSFFPPSPTGTTCG